MSQFGSMDEEKVIKKPLLPLSTMKKKKKKKKKKKPLLPLSEAQVLSLKAALLFACLYGGSAAYNLLRDGQHALLIHIQEPEPEPEPAWLVRRYVLTGADVVDAALALLRGLQAPAAVLALALLADTFVSKALAL